MPDVDIKIDLTTGDIAWDGDELAMVAGIELVQQRVIIGLRTFLREWFLDESVGVDWWGTVFTDRPKTTFIEAMLRREILLDEDIERLASFSMVVDKRARQLTVTFVAISTYGVISASEVLLP